MSEDRPEYGGGKRWAMPFGPLESRSVKDVSWRQFTEEVAAIAPNLRTEDLLPELSRRARSGQRIVLWFEKSPGIAWEVPADDIIMENERRRAN